MGFQPDFVAGHSYGEVSALWAAGVIGDDDFYRVSLARGRACEAPASTVAADSGAMLATSLDESAAQEVVQQVEDVYIANYNSHAQVVLGGSTPSINKVHELLTARKVRAQLLPVSAAFH